MDGMSRGDIYERGIRIVGEDNTPVTVNRLLSDMVGSADAYHVTYKDNDYVLMWYKNSGDVIGGEQYNTIMRTCGESNRPGKRILWPIHLVTEENPCNGKKFGYLMPFIPDGYYGMPDFLRYESDPKAVRFSNNYSMLTAGLNIAEAMQELHLKGYVHENIGPWSFTINPQTGDVFIVDSGNVSVDGVPCHVMGTRGYMAPETYKDDSRMGPTIDANYYSLAVVLYKLFFIDHPMDGKAWENYPLCTDKVEKLLYADKPVFHFDPDDDSNRPNDIFAPNAKIRWQHFPEEIKNVFTRVFTEGIYDPEKRPTEYEWIRVISAARDKMDN